MDALEKLLLPDEAEYPGELTEGFELLERMAGSGDSETLLARDRRTGEKMTVKCFRKEHPLYEKTEPEALRRLQAPPLPEFRGEYRNEKMRCVVRQYVEGESLAERAARMPLTEAEVREIGIELCRQLAILHAAEPPIIHRDVKPQNIILREDGTPVLIDFGISRVYTSKEADTLIMGTQGFAPPEQYGFSATDGRSDIYSLGMVLRWLLREGNAQGKALASPMERVIARMTAFDPDRRYASAERAAAALRNTTEKARRRVLAWAAAGIALAAVLIWGAFALLKPAEDIPVFTQPLIAEAARLNLGLEEGAALTRERLEDVRGIYLVAGTACADADAFYPAVSQWYAEGRPDRRTVSDLRDLALMPNLEQVCIAAEKVEDISALAGLDRLNKVEFKHNSIQDISPLAGKVHLSSVGLNENPVRDLSPLLECPELAFLDLCNVHNYDPEIISRLGNFSYLDIANATESYRYLGRKSIHALSLAWSGLTELTDLDGVTHLEDLEISHTAVSDLSPLTIHAGLKHLKMAAVPVKDLRPLLELPLLETVTLSPEMEPLVEGLEGRQFEVLYE